MSGVTKSALGAKLQGPKRFQILGKAPRCNLGVLKKKHGKRKISKVTHEKIIEKLAYLKESQMVCDLF